MGAIPVESLPLVYGRAKAKLITASGPASLSATGSSASTLKTTAHVGVTGEPRPPFRPNIIHILLDDAGRLQFGAYDDKNSWPEGYPYPDMPWLASKIADGIRYTKARVSPRCSPHRACALTGRRAHVSPGHPQGTLVGEVPNAAYQSEEFPFEGVKAEHRPWPEVARTANAGYQMGLFGKYHLFEYATNQSDVNVQNRLAPVDIAGFDVFHHADLIGNYIQNPDYGFFEFGTWETTRGTPSTATAATSTGKYMGTWEFEKITAFIDAAVASGDLWNVQWWTNLPHGFQPALIPGIGPDIGSGTEDLYSGDFDQAACVGSSSTPGDNLTSTDGKTTNGGYDADGTPDGAGLYGVSGQCNAFWRRQYTVLKCVDKLMSLLEEWLIANHPEVAANTLWLIAADNGVAGSDFTPIADDVVSPFNVLPPTMDDTVGGEQYHVAAHAKGSAHDEGILTPFVAWGGMLPASMRGVDCPALIESADWYPTFLDIMAGPVTSTETALTGRVHWKDAIGAEDLAKVDGISFVDTLFEIAAGERDYAFSQVFGPASALPGQETRIERAVVNRGGWKIHREYDESTLTDAWHLYDLNTDPREKVDLWDSADPDAVLNQADLQAEYDRIMA